MHVSIGLRALGNISRHSGLQGRSFQTALLGSVEACSVACTDPATGGPVGFGNFGQGCKDHPPLMSSVLLRTQPLPTRQVDGERRSVLPPALRVSSSPPSYTILLFRVLSLLSAHPSARAGALPYSSLHLLLLAINLSCYPRTHLSLRLPHSANLLFTT
jgi:hypothetical protein